MHFGPRRDDLTRFFGLLAALLSSLSFLLQMLGTPRLLQRFGIGAGLRVLPVGFLAGGSALLATSCLSLPPLWAAAAAMMLSEGFRFSVDRASVELLYVPIPRTVKDQAKPFVDTVVDRFAGALAGLLWLFLTWAFRIDQPSHLPYASIVTVVVSLVWLAAIRRSRRGYVDAYRRMLAPSGPAPDVQHTRTCELDQILRTTAQQEAPQRTRALRLLGRLQRTNPTLRADREAIEPHLRRETATLALLSRALAAEDVATRSHRRQHQPLLVRALEEKLDEALERTARLLALVYPRRDVFAAHRALAVGSAGARAGALELLDNLLEGDAKAELLQVLDEVALGVSRHPRVQREHTLGELLHIDDAWLRACAAHTARAAGVLSTELDCVAAKDVETLVREAASGDPRVGIARSGETPCCFRAGTSIAPRSHFGEDDGVGDARR
jgi:hypothetical protein